MIDSLTYISMTKELQYQAQKLLNTDSDTTQTQTKDKPNLKSDRASDKRKKKKQLDKQDSESCIMCSKMDHKIHLIQEVSE